MGYGIDGGGQSHRWGGRRGWRKHATESHKCPLCGKITRGNGGRTGHERACYKRHGIQWYSDAEKRILRD